jgi:hypothetical protein
MFTINHNCVIARSHVATHCIIFRPNVIPRLSACVLEMLLLLLSPREINYLWKMRVIYGEIIDFVVLVSNRNRLR